MTENTVQVDNVRPIGQKHTESATSSEQGQRSRADLTDNQKLMVELTKYRMPYGKYKDMRLVDLPEPYVVWFSQQGFPEGELGTMLAIVHEIKVNGLDHLFKSPKK